MSKTQYNYYDGTRLGRKLFFETMKPYGFDRGNMYLRTNATNWFRYGSHHESYDIDDLSTMHTFWAGSYSYHHSYLYLSFSYPYSLNTLLYEKHEGSKPLATNDEWTKKQLQVNGEYMRDLCLHTFGMVLYVFDKQRLRADGYNLHSYADDFLAFIKGERKRDRRYHLDLMTRYRDAMRKASGGRPTRMMS